MALNEIQWNQWFLERFESFYKDLKLLVSIQSVNSGKKKTDADTTCGDLNILQQTLNILERFGFSGKVQISDRYLFVSIPSIYPDAKTLGVFAHLDVVPEGNLDHWLGDPFQLTVHDGFLVGRGVADNKCSVLLMIYLMRYLKEKHIGLDYNILLFFGTDEENGMTCLQSYLQNHAQPDIAFTPDAYFPVCIGEKSRLEFCLKYKLDSSIILGMKSGDVVNTVADTAEAMIENTARTSSLIMDLRESQAIDLDIRENVFILKTQGISAHSASPEGSINAQVKLARFMLEHHLFDPISKSLLLGITELMEDYYGRALNIDFDDPDFSKLTIIAGCSCMQGSTYCQYLDCRTSPNQDLEAVIKSVTDKAQEYGFTVTVTKRSAGYIRDGNQPWLRKMAASAEKYYPPKHFDKLFYVMGGGTYARHLKNAVGYGLVNPKTVFPEGLCGPHKDNESLSMDEIARAFNIYLDFLLSMKNEDIQ